MTSTVSPGVRSQLGAQSPFKELVVDGVRLAYDDEGSGPPLVCLHAVAHGARDFETLRRRLRATQRVIALDWPGHGNSGDDSEPPTADRYAALLARFLDALAVERPVLLGNSIGGAAALRLATLDPDRVHGLVLVDPGGLLRGDALSRTAISLMVRFFTAGARGARWYPAAFAAYYRLVLPLAAAADQRRRIVAGAQEMAPLLASAWRGFAQPEADLRGFAERVRCPVLVAWAKGDRILQLARCRDAIRRFPNARLELFPGGHAPFLECPELFLPRLEAFLRGVDPCGAQG
ncbi:MAG TPA: alpha/beta hydrolase [Myxococcota bacterium]|nr:alpha/beta hydrolase [Myxococcota bacterium]